MRFKNPKRAVSPVVAVVLLIALVVAASAVVWSITNNLAEVPAELVVEKSEFSDVDDNKMADKLTLTIRNIGAEATNITTLVLTVDGAVFPNWVITQSDTIGVGSSSVFIMQTVDPSQQLVSNNEVIFTLTTDTNAVLQELLTVPTQFSIRQIGEAGTISVGGTPITVDLAVPYVEPIVVAVPVAASSSSVRSGNNAAQSHMITDVTTTSFTIVQISDSADSDGITETDVNYLVMEKGIHTIRTTTIVADKINATGKQLTYDFNYNFTSDPVLLASTQTNNEDGVPRTRGKVTNHNNFTLQIEDGTNSNPNNYEETVGYIAIEQGYDLTSGMQAYRTGDQYDDEWNTVIFNIAYLEAPVVLAHLSYEDGGDASYAAIADIFTTNFKVSVEETNGKNGPHTTERVDWFAIPSGAIYGNSGDTA